MSTVDRLIKQACTVRDANAATLQGAALKLLEQHHSTLRALALEAEVEVIPDLSDCYREPVGVVRWRLRYRGEELCWFSLVAQGSDTWEVYVPELGTVSQWSIPRHVSGPDDKQIATWLARNADRTDAKLGPEEP